MGYAIWGLKKVIIFGIPRLFPSPRSLLLYECGCFCARSSTVGQYHLYGTADHVRRTHNVVETFYRNVFAGCNWKEKMVFFCTTSHNTTSGKTPSGLYCNWKWGALVQWKRVRLQIERSLVRILHWPNMNYFRHMKWISEAPLVIWYLERAVSV